MEPVSALIGAWLGEWATVKVAEGLLNGMNSKLSRDDLDRALREATQAAQTHEGKLFFRCAKDGPRGVPRFLEQFFKGVGLLELQKPLNQDGIPDVDFLVAAFTDAANAHPEMQKINESLVKPWMETFVRTYFEKTSSYLRFQIAKVDYLEQLANWFDDVKFAGISVAGQEVERSAELAQIFVMPDVAEDPRGVSVEHLYSGFGEETGDRQSELLWEQQYRSQVERSGRRFSAEQLLHQNQKKVVLLGAPGSGKTTLMSYFAVTIAATTPEILPILIRIRDLARHADLGILDYVKQFAEKTMSVKTLPKGFFEYWLEDGRTLILLDGLDEVAEEAKRCGVVQKIENFLGQYNQNRAMITSRPAGYRRDFFKTSEFPHYELQPFDDAKIEEFINRWYDSRIRDSAEADRRKDSLNKALNANDRIKLLSRNPLLLTIVALIHRYQAVLPKERHKLYDKAVETLLTSWDANKELSNHTVLQYLGLDDLRRLMEQLAYWIHTQGNTGDAEGGTLIDREELIKQLAQFIKAQKGLELYQAKQEAERFVNFVHDRTGLLNEQGQDCYAFAHKTFQEYLTAQEINYRADNEDEFVIVLDHIKHYLHDPHWCEVLLLLIAQQKPKKAAKAIRFILDANSLYEQWLHRDLLFAGSCLAENPKDLQTTDPELPQIILEGLVELEAEGKLSSKKVRSQVFTVLCSMGDTAFESLTLQALNDKLEKLNQAWFQECRASLREKEEAINKLLVLLKDEDFKVRGCSINSLKRIGNKSQKVIQELLAALQDMDPYVKRDAALALGDLGCNTEAVRQAILEMLIRERSNTSSAGAALALVKLASTIEQKTQHILPLLKHKDPMVRLYIVFALGVSGDSSKSIIKAMLPLLEDDNDGVRINATRAFCELRYTSDSVIQNLLSMLDSKYDSYWRSEAAFYLGELKTSSGLITQTLQNNLKDESPSVRISTTYALMKLGETFKELSPIHLSSLESSVALERYSIAKTLEQLVKIIEIPMQHLFAFLEGGEATGRNHFITALVNASKKSDRVLPAVVKWIEEHQHSEYVGVGIDALWEIVS